MANIYGRSNLSWEDNKVIFKRKEFGISLVEDKEYPSMFWIKYSNGELSKDFYNLSRAKQHAINISLDELNKDLSSDLKA